MKKINKALSVFLMIILVSFSVLPTFATSLSEPATEKFMDNSGILNDTTKLEIKGVNDAIKDYAEIYIVTVKTTDGKTEKEFAKEIYDGWEIGGKTKQNGILFLVSLGESGAGPTYYGVVGAGISQGFENGILDTIFKTKVETSFASADYNTAVKNFMYECKNILLADVKVTPSPSASATPAVGEEKEEGGVWATIWGVIRTILIILLVIVILAIAALIFLNIRANRIIQKRKEELRKGKGRRRPVQPKPKAPQQEEVTEFEDLDS